MFPPDLLGDDEDLVLDLRPHWIALIRPAIQLAVILAAATAGLLFVPFRLGPVPFVAIGLVALAGALLGPLPRMVRWATSRYLVTTERVMARSGLVGRAAASISLARVTDVRVRQSLPQRMARAGDLVIESAGTAARLTFESVPSPERVQRVLFERRSHALRGPPAGPPSVADEISKLDRLRRDGVLDDGEFARLKARLLDRDPSEGRG